MKKKIVIPSEEDVARYGGDPVSPQPTSNQPEDKTTDSPQEGAGGQSAAEAGQSASEAPLAPEVLKAEAEQWKDKCLRAKAELANYQRRMEKERTESLRYANAGLVKAMLPVLDDLDRVLAAPEHKNDPDALVGGLKLVLENFTKVLKEFGVHQIEAADKPFDPNHHEAISQQPSPDHAEPTVLTEVAKGYLLHDRVLRPARVIVSKPVEKAPAPEEDVGEDPEE